MTAAPSAKWESESGNRTRANAPSVAIAMRKFSSNTSPLLILRHAFRMTSYPAIRNGIMNAANDAYTANRPNIISNVSV